MTITPEKLDQVLREYTDQCHESLKTSTGIQDLINKEPEMSNVIYVSGQSRPLAVTLLELILVNSGSPISLARQAFAVGLLMGLRLQRQET